MSKAFGGIPTWLGELILGGVVEHPMSFRDYRTTCEYKILSSYRSENATWHGVITMYVRMTLCRMIK
jgi:hypothetical protein